MYNKIIKKYYIQKLYSFCMPLSPNIKKTNYYLCKYLIKNTPYGNILTFIKELQKIILINKNTTTNKKFILGCTHKIYLLNIFFHDLKIKNNKANPDVFFIMCGNNYTSKQIAYFKDRKIPSIGFMNFHHLSQLTDFTLLLQSKYFASTFLIYYFIKKLFKNANY